MRISIDRMRAFIDLPSDPRAVRDLFDDLGLEVKRHAVDPDVGEVFTLELLANRGDHHGYEGLAREIRGRTGGSVRVPPIATLDAVHATADAGLFAIPLVNEAEERLLVYTATLLERGANPTELDADELFPILAAGQKPVSAPVDATNLANLELGQPTHAFDADRIDGHISIRGSVTGEKAWPLFAAGPVELRAGTLVIADASKILAIAGVIGCEESKTTAATTRIVLESATFDPIAVRKAARALEIHTDSSARFERGGDPCAPLTGAGRAVYLLERHGWKRVGATAVLGRWTNPNRVIDASIAAMASAVAVPLTGTGIAERLGRYGFTVAKTDADTLRVGVPSHRLWDVTDFADLIEEVAKSIGYNATPSVLPPVEMGSLPSIAEDQKSAADEVLVGYGFFEVFTDGFYARDARERLGLAEGHALWAHVETQNAVDRGYSLLKNNTLAQAIDAVAVNLRLHAREVRAYEWTRTFHPDPAAANGVCTERKVLWAIACGPARSATWAEDPLPADVHFARGVIEELSTALGVPLTLGAPDPSYAIAGCLHPNRQVTVRRGDTVVGIVGEVHPTVLAAYKIKRERPVYLEIDQAALLIAPSPAPFAAPADVQAITRDLAFTLPHRFAASDLVDHLRANGPAWLGDVAITDRFDHTVDDKPVRTLTFTLTFVREQTPTTDELNRALEALIAAVQSRFADAGVRLRT